MSEDPENGSPDEGEPSEETEGGPSDESEAGSAEETNGGNSEEMDTGNGEQTDGGSSEEPSDAATEQALLATVDPAEAQSLAGAIATHHGVGGGFGAETLDVAVSDPEQMSGEPIRAECGPKGCDFSVTVDGEVFALVGCGDGTCPTCPPGLGNLIVRHWCAYVGLTSQRSAIVLILLFGAKLGPFVV
jgi:hypothetical protein